jgi:putative ABC transport system permease protein
METLGKDIRYALVTMRRSPGFAAAALLTLALGIGATAAVFSVVYGVLLRPLPYPDPERLVRLWEEHPGGTTAAGQRWLSSRTYEAWTESPRTLDGVGGYSRYEYTITFGEEPVRIFGGELSPQVFTMLGATPALGRFFSREDAIDGSAKVAVLTDRLWRERYGASPDVLSKQLVIDGEPHVIVGVARPELAFPERRVLFWTPYILPRVDRQGPTTRVFSAIGRLKPGVSTEQAEAEGTAAARSMPRPMSTELFFGKGGPVVVHVRPLADDMTATVGPALRVLAGGVVLVLLIACANVANLFLSRGVARQRELALRAAIGASRGRLARQLLTESLVLAVGGGLAGLFLAWSLIRVLPALAPTTFPRLDDVRLDWPVIAFTAVAAIFTALASGAAPAARGVRFELSESLHGGDGSSAGGFRGRRARRLRDGLLVLESAFAVILLVGAALLGHSFVRLTTVDAGYDAAGVLTVRASVPRNAPPERMTQLIDGALERLRATPGVVSAGAANMIPLMSMTAITSLTLPPDAGGGKPTTTRSLTYNVTPGYAEALRLRLKEGRFFRDEDIVRLKPDAAGLAGGMRFMIVNEEFVRQYLTPGPVAGRRFADLSGENGTTTEIVGVVGNVLKDGNDRQPQPEIYFVPGTPTRRIVGWVNFVIRTTGNPPALSERARTIVREVDPAAVVERVEPLTAMVSASVAQPRFATTVLGAFASLALALAAVGLYGVLSYGVSQHRRELGLRAALGAARTDLVRLVLREGLRATLLGAVIGLAAATALTRLMEAVLFGVTPLDGLAFTLAPLALLPVAVAACLLPALRAAAIDPAVALRCD